MGDMAAAARELEGARANLVLPGLPAPAWTGNCVPTPTRIASLLRPRLAIICPAPSCMPDCVVRVVCRKEDAPAWLHKEHIAAYYLHSSNSHYEAAKHTLFGWTNETLNAWTTIVALLVVHVLYFYSR